MHRCHGRSPSPGAPASNAGPDQIVPKGIRVTLTGTVKGAGKIKWLALAGPGVVKFGNATLAHTMATFPLPGHCVLALSVTDNVHAVTYDAVAVDVLL